jgi:Protein of unknown function (DUF2569)
MNRPQGFGGWLIVALLQCLVTAALAALDLFDALRDGALAGGAAGGLPLWIAVLSIAINLAAVALMMAESRYFTPVFAASLVWRILKNAVDLLTPHQDLKDLSTNTTALLTAIAIALIWGLYLRNSQRVRNTFPPLRTES